MPRPAAFPASLRRGQLAQVRSRLPTSATLTSASLRVQETVSILVLHIPRSYVAHLFADEWRAQLRPDATCACGLRVV